MKCCDIVRFLDNQVGMNKQKCTTRRVDFVENTMSSSFNHSKLGSRSQSYTGAVRVRRDSLNSVMCNFFQLEYRLFELGSVKISTDVIFDLPSDFRLLPTIR